MLLVKHLGAERIVVRLGRSHLHRAARSTTIQSLVLARLINLLIDYVLQLASTEHQLILGQRRATRRAQHTHRRLALLLGRRLLGRHLNIVLAELRFTPSHILSFREITLLGPLLGRALHDLALVHQSSDLLLQ